MEILLRDLLHKSCQESFHRELVQRSHKEILADISLIDLLSRGLAKRPL